MTFNKTVKLIKKEIKAIYDNMREKEVTEWNLENDRKVGNWKEILDSKDQHHIISYNL